MFEWSDARVFLAIARTGSLSAAARVLHVEQSTVGRRLSALEAALGVRLFDRTSTGLAATDAAAGVKGRFEAMEDEALATEREVGGREAQLSGLVRLTAPEIFGAEVVSPMLVAFQRKHPRIALELIADNRNLNLSRREADLAIRLVRPTQAGLVSRKIGALPSSLVASKEYLARKGRPTRGDFRGHDFILYDDTFQPVPETQWYAQHAKQGTVVLRSNSSRVFLSAVRAGAGLAILQDYLTAPEPEIVRVVPKAVLRDVWLVLHPDLRRAARIRALADFLAAQVGKEFP